MSQPDLILTADIDYLTPAIHELKAVDPNVNILGEVAKGVVTAVTQLGFFQIAEKWRASPPIFTRHIAPVQLSCSLNNNPSDIESICHIVKEELIPFFEPDMSFSVQTRCVGQSTHKPFQFNEALAPLIEKGTNATLNVKNPLQILSILVNENNAYLGLSLAQHNLSNWAGGVRRFAKEKGQISRAEFKLLEALEQFHLELPARSHALDLGASPGGWTRVLRQKGVLVTAVDPGQLHPSLAHDKAIRHLPIAAEKYLTQYPDSYDLIVNDMRLDARDSARLMVKYAPYLYAHGEAIMTLKLPTADPLKPLDHALNILKDAFTIVQTRQLFHNRHEVTVYLKKLFREKGK